MFFNMYHPSENSTATINAHNHVFKLGVIHILRNHQGGWGFRNDYANVIFALSNAEFYYGSKGEGLETDKK